MKRMCLFFVSFCLTNTGLYSDAETLQPPTRQKIESYRILYSDIVSVVVYDEPELTLQQRIDGDGNIKMPLLGTVKLYGKTSREAESYIEEQLVAQRFLRSPSVTVSIASYASLEIMVIGQVGKPGPFKLPVEQTSIDIVDLISRVGGFTSIAKDETVTIKRELENGMMQQLSVNVAALISGKVDGKPRQTFELFPGDIVYVGEAWF